MRKAFTLLELMMVVVLMGMVYGLVINVFERYREKSIDVTLMSLESYMKNFFHNNHVSMVCTRGCKECFLFVDGTLKQQVTPFVDNSVELYRFDKDYGVRELELLPHFSDDGHEEESCFRYEILSDGTRTEMIVKDGTRVYAYPSYFGSVRTFASVNEAIEYFNTMQEKAAGL